jgi:hypothetical protein
MPSIVADQNGTAKTPDGVNDEARRTNDEPAGWHLPPPDRFVIRPSDFVIPPRLYLPYRSGYPDQVGISAGGRR